MFVCVKLHFRYHDNLVLSSFIRHMGLLNRSCCQNRPWLYQRTLWNSWYFVIEENSGLFTQNIHLPTLQRFRPLTHWGRVMHMCVSKLDHHWFRWWLVACSVPGHYLNQCWHIIIWIFFTEQNSFENIVCNMTTTLPRPQSARKYYHVYPMPVSYICNVIIPLRIRCASRETLCLSYKEMPTITHFA